MSELLLAEPGTVVRYRPPYEQGRDAMWCREGLAIALDDGRLLDTYWGSRDMMIDKFVLADWADSVEVLGNLADFRPIERGESAADFAARDRLSVTRQHGLQRQEYVRIGAEPHYVTRVRAQVKRVREKRSALRDAQWGVEWAERDLHRLLADRAPRPTTTERPAAEAVGSEGERCE